MTPPDDAPLALRLLALVGIGGGISLVTLLGAALLEVLRPILRAYGERHARRLVRPSTPPPPES